MREEHMPAGSCTPSVAPGRSAEAWLKEQGFRRLREAFGCGPVFLEPLALKKLRDVSPCFWGVVSNYTRLRGGRMAIKWDP